MANNIPIPQEVPGSLPNSLASSPEMENLRKAQVSAPVASGGFGQTRVPQAAPAQVNPDDENYKNSGLISIEQVINGRASDYIHLDETIQSLVAQVQKDLVDAGTQLNEARHDKKLKAHAISEIDRITSQKLLAEGRSQPKDRPIIIASVINEIIGLGPIEPIWQDPSITEVIVNGPEDIYIERGGKLVKARGVRFRSADHLLEICSRIVSPLGRSLDISNPTVDARLPDGSRVNAVHYAIAPKGPLLTIRRFPEVNRSLVDLVEIDSMTQEMACTLAWLVASRASLLVVGGTGTGKTTLLNALSAAIPRDERVITIEDSLELRLHPASHVAAMEARPKDSKNKNSVEIKDLVKNALRMRPDRIIVGEVRGAEALNMLEACNTGHEGSMSTIHANGSNEALARLAVMIAQGGEMPSDKVDWLVGSALDLMIQIRRYKDGSRRISGIYEVPDIFTLEPGQPMRTIPLWEWHRSGEDPNTGKFIGEYRQVNEVSKELQEKLGLEFEPRFDWNKVIEISRG